MHCDSFLLERFAFLRIQCRRQLATIKKEELGTLYRCKAVLAVAGSNQRLVFHAVSDVLEKELVSEWPAGATRGCKIVFIGKSLKREWFETSFNATLQPIRADFVLDGAAAAAEGGEGGGGGVQSAGASADAAAAAVVGGGGGGGGSKETASTVSTAAIDNGPKPIANRYGSLLSPLFAEAPAAFYKILAHCNSGDVVR